MLTIIMLLLLAIAVITLCSSGWRSPSNAAAALLSLVVMGMCIYSIVVRSVVH